MDTPLILGLLSVFGTSRSCFGNGLDSNRRRCKHARSYKLVLDYVLALAYNSFT
jgi:hypothetical protein